MIVGTCSLDWRKNEEPVCECKCAFHFSNSMNAMNE